MKILLIAAIIAAVSGYMIFCVAAPLGNCSSSQQDDQFAFLMEQAKWIVEKVGQAVQTWESRPRHCKDLLDSGDREKGLRQIYPYPGQPHNRVTVYCDHTVDGGGWTVIQRRSNDTVRQDFYRKWVEYQLGFGDLEGEFWVGLDLLHELTSTTMQKLRIDLDDFNGKHRWAKYGYFHVGLPGTSYRLNIGRYSGDAGDGMAHNDGRQFSTYDNDNDGLSSTNCAVQRRGAWWYGTCSYANPNGYQHEGNFTGSHDQEGIMWHYWRGPWYSLRRTAMMIRPTF